jgi:2-methylisocitrate lyase-like PEP mutase family enzyme
MVARTVQQYAKAGVAALHIEDQVQTKRCGHLLGKQVVSREEYLIRVRAAVLARDSIPGGSDFVSIVISLLVSADSLILLKVIIARTDSAQVLGMEEAVTRLKLASDASADVCFIEGVRTKELLESTVAALAPRPVSHVATSSISLDPVTKLLGPRECNCRWFDAIFHDRMLQVPRSSVRFGVMHYLPYETNSF